MREGGKKKRKGKQLKKPFHLLFCTTTSSHVFSPFFFFFFLVVDGEAGDELRTRMNHHSEEVLKTRKNGKALCDSWTARSKLVVRFIVI